MTDEIEQLLKNLKLGRMRSIYDEQLRAAEKQQVSYSEFVAALLRAQWHHRQESALGVAHRPRQSARTLVTGNLSLQPPTRREAQADSRLRGTRLRGQTRESGFRRPHRRRQDRTGLRLLLKALQNGLRCQFIRAQDLFDEMYASLADRSTRKLINHLARLDVL